MRLDRECLGGMVEVDKEGVGVIEVGIRGQQSVSNCLVPLAVELDSVRNERLDSLAPRSRFLGSQFGATGGTGHCEALAAADGIVWSHGKAR